MEAYERNGDRKIKGSKSRTKKEPVVLGRTTLPTSPMAMVAIVTLDKDCL
jgi:hypothetical protein